jgi:lipopolysaccharide transport system ATP-binding protein
MVRVSNLSKMYRLYDRPWYRLREWVTRRPRHREFWALRDVNLSVPRGLALGVVGPNGAGKSTLLKILSGVTHPTRGELVVEGRVTALLELGTGFHPEFTGRQNIFLNGRLLGISEPEIQARVGEIISFSELGEFIDQPVRTYSSGMYMRLAFSVAASLEPDVLVIDEIFAVGDAHFQQKCVRRIREFKERGATILFVSHDPGAVKTLCDEAVLLHQGQVADYGAPDEVLDYYNALIAREHGEAGFVSITRQPAGSEARQRTGTFEAVITGLRLLDAEGHEVKAVTAGQPVTISVRISFLADIENPTVGILVRDRFGNDIFGTNTYNLRTETGSFHVGDELEVDWALDMDIGPGQYTITVAAHTEDVHIQHCFDWADTMASFQVLPRTDYHFIGTAHLRPKVSMRRTQGVADLAAVLRSLYPDAPTSLGMMDERHLLHGWYQVEDAGGRPMRWTRGEFAFVLRGPARAIGLEACCGRPDIRERPVHGRVSVNGVEAGELVVESNHLRHALVPVELKDDGPVRVEVELDHTWVPDDYGITGDRRELGIFVARAWAE